MTKKSDLGPTLFDELCRNLESLKLAAVLAHLDEAIEQAAQLEQGYGSFLAGLIHHEVLARNEAGATRRLAAAKLPVERTFDNFNWTFQRTLNVQLVKDLQNLQFIEQGRNVLLLGRPGTGKTHLSVAFSTLATRRGYTVRFYSAPQLLAELYASLADNTTDKVITRLARVDLLIVDDLRPVPPRREYATLFFDLVEARHMRKPIILSSNVSVSEWGKILGDSALTAALVDRLMDKAHVINIRKGRSYRAEGPDASPDRPADLDTDEDAT